MEKENKSVAKSVKNGFARGLMGKEEDTSKARTLTSSEPLPNEVKKFRKYGYIACFACILLGYFYNPLAAVGLFGLIIVYTIIDYMCKYKSQKLRMAKFKINPEVTNEILFSATQPVFVSKYNLLVEKNQDGTMRVNRSNYMYDIKIKDDGTFVVWWRASLKKAFFTLNYYKLYRTVLADIGFIAYEIQHAVGVE